MCSSGGEKSIRENCQQLVVHTAKRFSNTRDEFDAPEEVVTIAGPGEFENVTLPTNANATPELDPKCLLPVDEGNGTMLITRFYYDAQNKSCVEFNFTGENGNSNRFENVLDCLTDCYIDVGEAEPIKEEDVVIISPRSIETSPFITPADRCVLPESIKDCERKHQRYYYSYKWQACLAYLSCKDDDNYDTRADCESNCKPLDGSVCGPRQDSVEATKMGTDCDSTECPKGSLCLQGMIPQCCTDASREDVDFLYGEHCPDGKIAFGHTDQYFLPEIAENCSQLQCPSDTQCQEQKGLAKCCVKSKKNKNTLHELVAHDVPLIERRGFKRGSIRSQAPAAMGICRLPKQIGNCTQKIQRFYFDSELQSCFAFKFSGCNGNQNSFSNRQDCETSCLVANLSICRGNQQTIVPMKLGVNCTDTICPSPNVCVHGIRGPECCNRESQAKFNALYDEKCPGGRLASGRQTNGVFDVTFAKTCSDLICPFGYTCEQLDSGLAKCCQWPLFSRDQPLNAGSTSVTEKCPSIERRLTRSCAQVLTDSEVVRNIWKSPRIISAESIIQHLNTICSKFDEYKGCLTSMTSTAACLDPILARKEQMFDFVCNRSVRETISSTDNQRCLRRISKLPKIRDCEDDLTNGLVNNAFDKFTICRAFDKTLECASTELLKCGPNTFWLTKNIIGTLKSHIHECNGRFVHSSSESMETELSEEVDENESIFIATTIQPRVAATKTHVPKNRKSNRRTKKDACPEDLIERAENCASVLGGHRKLREIFRLPADFVLGNFELGNINAYCNRSQAYRRCIELALSTNEACLVHLKEDFAYSFVVAFDDRLCEREKQLRWLINSGCLTDVLQLNRTKSCLNDLETTDERVFCRTLDQMENCVMPSIESECRLLEVQFFTDLFEMMQKRRRLCSPSNATLPLGALRAKFLRQLSLHDDSSQMSRPLSLKGCRSARKIAIFVLHHFVPECDAEGKFKPTQCDRKSGNCWCVDEETGLPIRNSLVGPGRALPMCGASSLFSCEKLPPVQFCDVDQTQPQLVERWYREGDECRKYLFTHCPASSHIPPMNLRTKAACQSFCLPLNG
ncbi:Major allergen Ani s 1 [Aphelenchoides besseyi]|nr:Major allergen Ani s 1 [Aphelenchoides besseyi]